MAELADRNEGYVRTAVSAPEVTVTVAGVVRKAESVSISAEGGGGLPDQVSSVGTGMLSRTGSITWSSDEAVDRMFGNPATALIPGGWPPAQGDPVTVDVTVGGKTWRRFTGRIGKTKGGVATGSLVSDITDDIEARLTNPVTIGATSNSSAEGTFYAAEALRLAGIGPLPADPPTGTILYHLAASGVALVGKGPWGGATDGQGTPPVSVMSTSYAEPADTGSTSTGLLLFAELCDPRLNVSGSTTITLTSGARIDLSLGQEVDGRIPVTVSTSLGTAGTVPVTMGRDGITDLCVHISSTGAAIQVWDGAKFVNISVPVAVRVPVTEKVTRFTPLSYSSMTGVMLIRTNGTGTVMSEAQARPRHRISRPYQSTSPGNVVGNPSTGGFQFTRSIVSTTSRSILDQFCQAGLYSQWIDEHGRYVIRHVTSPMPSKRQTTPPLALDEMVDASWTVDSTEVVSRVLVQHQVGHLRSIMPSNTVTTDNQPRTYDAEEFEAGATSLSVETWYSVPETEEWGPLNLPVRRLTSSSTSRTINAAYSYTAAQVRTETATTWADKAATPVTVTSVAERVGPRSVKVTDTITKPAADAEVILALPENGDHFYKTGLVRGGPAPVLRAAWITDWVDVEKSGRFTGPVWAPAYVHEAGALVPPYQAQWVADYLSYWLSEPRLVFDQIDMLWSPSRSVGDSEVWDWWWSSVDLPRTSVLIAGITEEYQTGSAPTQTITARLATDVTREARDYQDLADQYARYADIPSTRTYQDVYSALPERPA